MFVLIPFFIVFLIIVLNGLFTVKQQTVAVIERLGKFQSIKGPGLHLKIPILDSIAGRLNLKIQQLDVIVETKTEDNVFTKLKVSVQFMILKEATYEAFYKLQSPYDQITSYVFDTVRAEVPKMILDDVFVKKTISLLQSNVNLKKPCKLMDTELSRHWLLTSILILLSKMP